MIEETLDEIRIRIREGGIWDVDCPGYIARELMARLIACRADREGLLKGIRELQAELAKTKGIEPPFEEEHP